MMVSWFLKRMELVTTVEPPWVSSMAVAVHPIPSLDLQLQSQVFTPFVPFGMKVAVVPIWNGQPL
jgi:hypothetical protein